MPKEIRLDRCARMFERSGGPKSRLLARAGHVCDGEDLTISDPITMSYDHRDQEAVEIMDGEYKGRFLLVHEAGIVLAEAQ